MMLYKFENVVTRFTITTSPLPSHKKHQQKVLFDWMQKPLIHRNARFEDLKHFKKSVPRNGYNRRI